MTDTSLTGIAIRTASLLICLLLLQACGPSTIHSDPPKPNYDFLKACTRPADEPGAIYVESLCGSISVYEDRDSRSGRRIDLNIMVIPAQNPVAKPDPIFFLAGGPGQAATRVGPSLFSQLQDLRKDRDIILVDQRGTGDSNSLACDMGDDDEEFLDRSLDTLIELQISTLRLCLAEFEANPAFYTTPVAADDLDEVRRTIGFDKINLYGVSYGTRLGLVYLRRHGESVRSLVLDGLAPMSMSIGENIATDAQAAFERMLSDCRSDPVCDNAFPELETRFEALLHRLRLSAQEVTLRHPLTGASLDVLIEATTLTRIVRTVLYDRRLSTVLPLALNEAFDGNYAPVAALGYAFSGEPSDMSIGLMASVLCSEDLRNTTAPNDSPWFDNAVYNSLKPVCSFWPVGDIPTDYFDPVVSSVPALLVSGQLDPVTPPIYGEQAASTLSNAHHIIAPGVGHFASAEGCLRDVVADFFNHPVPADISAGCVSDLRRLAFFPNPSGGALPGDTMND